MNWVYQNFQLLQKWKSQLQDSVYLNHKRLYLRVNMSQFHPNSWLTTTLFSLQRANYFSRAEIKEVFRATGLHKARFYKHPVFENHEWWQKRKDHKVQNVLKRLVDKFIGLLITEACNPTLNWPPSISFQWVQGLYLPISKLEGYHGSKWPVWSSD